MMGGGRSCGCGGDNVVTFGFEETFFEEVHLL